MIHQIDECCWIKDAWPVSAHGVGGRIAGSTDCSQNLDSYSIEYTFADGTKALVTGRYIPNCFNDFATFVHGTKCAAQFSGNIHAPRCTSTRTSGSRPTTSPGSRRRRRSIPGRPNGTCSWTPSATTGRTTRPSACGLSNLAAIMGRAAVHIGKIVTWEEAMASKFQFCPNVAGLTADSPAPVHADAEAVSGAHCPGRAWKSRIVTLASTPLPLGEGSRGEGGGLEERGNFFSHPALPLSRWEGGR